MASLDMGAKNQYSSINFFGGFIEGISIVNFCGRFLHRCFWSRGEASQVLVDRWITSETFHDVQNVNRRCTGHATMSPKRGNYRLIAIAPNQKSLSNCCMEAPSHWPEMKNLGRCSPWNFTPKYCTYTCHTKRVYSPPKVPLRPLSQTFLRIPKQYFVFISSPKKQTHTACNNRPNIVDLSYRWRTEKLHFGLANGKKRCMHCN